jgi:hypothetical protein
MSTSNIVSITPVLAGDIPVGVEVTFSTKKGTRTYFYSGVTVAAAILKGEDPIVYAGSLTSKDEV